MKKNIFLLGVISSLFFISCKKDEEVKPVEESKKTVQPFSGEAWLKQRIGNQGQQQPAQQKAPQSVQNQQAVATAPGMNPPHGQPGHRCDIAVGAPLSSKTTQNIKTQTVTPKVNPKPVEQPVMNVNSKNGAATIVGTSTPPGINPPHGQEGHRCDIAVGAPLPKQ